MTIDTNPLISIILTVYNRTEYLANAIKSVLAQTFIDWEIIIADDSGTTIALPYYNTVSNDTRIVYCPNDSTLGVALSLKNALMKARGTYVSVLNDDDWWSPDFLEKLIEPLQANSNRVLAFCDHWIAAKTGEIDQASTNQNTRLYKRDLLKTGDLFNTAELVLVSNSIPLAMASIFRKDALDPDQIVNEVAGAYDFWISCLLAKTGFPFYYVNDRLTYYRIHEQMETGRRHVEKNKNTIYIMEKLLDEIHFAKMNSLLLSRYSVALYSVGKDYLFFQNKSKARQYFKKSFLVQKSYRTVIIWILSFFPEYILRQLRLMENKNS